MAPHNHPGALMVLGIETATAVCSVGLAEGAVPIAESWIQRPRAHAERLPGMVERLLEDVGIGPDRITSIGVSIGPGSFTGLRVGLAAAKGYAAAWRLPVIPVETTAALAWPLMRRGRRIMAGLGTRNRLVYAAVYRWSRGGPTRCGDFYVGDPRALPVQTTAGLICVGPAGDGVWRRYIRRTGKRADLAPATLHRPSGAMVACAAGLRAAAEEPEPWEALEPLYLQGYPVQRSRR
jgi:tRNA threonylcarbamoyladenosine biosynthesis protein TsaB